MLKIGSNYIFYSRNVLTQLVLRGSGCGAHSLRESPTRRISHSETQPRLNKGRCVPTRNKIQMSFPKSRKMSHIDARVCCMQSCTRKIIWCSLIRHDDMIRQLNSTSVVGQWAVQPAARTPIRRAAGAERGKIFPTAAACSATAFIRQGNERI